MEEDPEQVYSLTVIAVDDDPAMLEVVAKYLTSKGLRVVSTTDPEAVPALAAKEKPRLIISDINMPGIDGLALLKRLKANPVTSDIPLILLTSSKATEDVADGLVSGAEAYLLKPIDWELSWPKIQAILLRT